MNILLTLVAGDFLISMSHMFHVHTEQELVLCKIFNKTEMTKSQLAKPSQLSSIEVEQFWCKEF